MIFATLALSNCTFALGLGHGLFGLLLGFYFFIFITQGLHTINNKILVIVHDYMNKNEKMIVNVMINMHF